MMAQGTAYFQTATAYDEAAYTVLVNLMMKHLRRWPRYVVLATGLVSVVYSGYTLLASGQLSGVALLFLFLGNAFVVLGLLAPRFAVRLMVAGNRKDETPVNTYAFYNDGLTIHTQEGPREYSYAYIRRIMDIQGYFVFFFRDGQAFLVRHADMDKEKKQALHAFLDSRLAESRGGVNAAG